MRVTIPLTTIIALLLLSGCHIEEQTIDGSPGGRLIDQSNPDRGGERLINQSEVGQGERLIDRNDPFSAFGGERLIDRNDPFSSFKGGRLIDQSKY